MTRTPKHTPSEQIDDIDTCRASDTGTRLEASKGIDTLFRTQRSRLYFPE